MTLLQKTAQKVRSRFHPLHRLRRNWFYQRIIQPVFDIPIQANLGFRHPVYLRLLTHFSFLFLSRKMEERILETLTVIVRNLRVSQHSFLDVGANIGLYTWHALDVKPELHVASFEPDPRNSALLEKTSRKWSAPNLRLYSEAASNNRGQATFSRDLLSSATGSLDQSEPSFAEQHYGQRKSLIEVPTTTLDEAAADLPPPALVKIDVEGHERAVLEGARGILEKHQPILLIESFGEKAQGVREILEPLGYQFQDADRAEPATPETMNYMCLVPAETDARVLEGLARQGFPFNS